jgi:hypothetical protein
MCIDFIEAATEWGVRSIRRAPHARPLTAVSGKDESNGRVLSDARPAGSGTDLVGLFRRRAQGVAQRLRIGERNDQTFRKPFAAVTGGCGDPLDLGRVRACISVEYSAESAASAAFV